MRIAIASGKGGTGKTTVATNLAFTAAGDGRKVHLVDCDVEAPNCHLFVEQHIERSGPVTVPVPRIDAARCTGCGECGEICEFNALACLPQEVLVFPELCHGCGGCWLVCPEKAVTRGVREIGTLVTGTANGFRFSQGRLRIGETQVPPLIERVKAEVTGREFAIIDAPPGTSCPAIAALRGSDFVVLVTEPTPFGLYDLTLAVETVRQVGVPCGVVVNRHGVGDDRVHRYCEGAGIPVLLEIPDDRRIAEAYSRGILAVTAVPELYPLFHGLHAGELVGREGSAV